MRVLVTGANGQVGFSLGEQLKKTNWQFKLCTRLDLDITNKDSVKKIVGDFLPDVIVNPAAYTAVDKAESNSDEAFAINALGVENLAEVAKNNNCVLLHISTDYVFSGDKDGLYREDDETGPQGVYGRSKLVGEQVIKNILEKYIVLRTAWVFGEHGNNFVKTMIRLGRDRDQLNVVADQYGGPTYAGDIANAILKIISKIDAKEIIPWGTYHFSGAPHLNWHDFATAIIKQAELNNLYSKPTPIINAITTADYPTPAKRPKNSRLDCSKIEKVFSIEPSDWMAALKNINAYS